MSCCRTTREAELVRGFDPGWADLLTRLHSAAGCTGTKREPRRPRAWTLARGVYTKREPTLPRGVLELPTARWETELDRSHDWLVNLDHSDLSVRHATCVRCGATESSRYDERCAGRPPPAGLVARL